MSTKTKRLLLAAAMALGLYPLPPQPVTRPRKITAEDVARIAQAEAKRARKAAQRRRG